MENKMSQWSPQQDEALRKVSQWLKNPGDQQLFRLFGYAGTGKTTLARHLAEGVGGEVIFAAYTGKAASVLRKSGAVNAQTLHSLIYLPKDRSKERYNDIKDEIQEIELMLHEERVEYGPEWTGNAKLEDRLQKLRGDLRVEERNHARPDFSLNVESSLRNASLLVVDECSMVNEEMAGDIMSFGVPVLVLGDPEQLPPVMGTGFFTNAKPNVMLTEIHRQARDNPIIDLATRVRSRERLQQGRYGSSAVINRATPELALTANQILVGTNSTRISTNDRVRQLKQFTNRFPMEGEKLVCLRNDKEHGLLNGTLHTVLTDSEELGGYVNLRIRPEDTPGAEPLLVPAHPEHFGGDPNNIGHWDRRNAQEFTFGYALTVHKSQGSQWDNVLIIDQSSVFKDPDTRRKWLYTAITRAAEVVCIVSGG
jgi:exodeoxyribonuclease-5